MFATLQRSLENPLSRIVLSAAIIISLAPHEWMHATDAWFMVLFGPEVLARGLLIFRRESLPVPAGSRPTTGWRRPRTGEVVLLLFDLLALISFIPAATSAIFGARWLRLFRLTRTVLLLRYWAPVVRDLWEVSWRPERRRQLFFVFGSLVLFCFGGAVLLDHVTTEIGDDFDGDGVVGDTHDKDFFVRMWWAFRQLEDPGNLLASPHDTGTLVVSVALTMAGLFVVSFIIGIGADVVTDLSALGRIRAPGLRGHTVIVHAATSGKRLLRELLHEEFKLLPTAPRLLGFRWLGQLWRNVRTKRAFVVVGREHERPSFLREREFASVVYRAWDDGDDDTLMTRADVLNARRGVVLAAEGDSQPDDDTIRTLLTVVEQMRDCEDQHPRRLLAEITNLDNIPAADQAAARARRPLNTTVLPTEALIARCVAAVCRRRGLAELLIQLLRSEGREIYTWEARASAPPLPACGGSHPLETLARAGGTGSSPAKRVVPIGLIVADDPSGTTRAVLNPDAQVGSQLGGQLNGEIRGLIAVADNAARLGELVARAGDQPPQQPSAKFEAHFTLEAPVSLRRVLVCGFRSATVQLLDSLLREAEPGARVLVLVTDEQTREQALDAFDGHAALLRQGLLAGAHGGFTVDGTQIQWNRSDARSSVLIDVEVAEWTSPRVLGELPGEPSNAVDFDLVLFTADGSGESDARNTTGLMTVEALASRRGASPGPRVVAEVDDVELAARLNERFLSMGRPEVQVFSIDELRALVVFQSVVVPHFGSIYEELLAPGGRGLAPLRAQDGPERVPYNALAETLRAQGHTLVAIEDDKGVRFGRGTGSDDGVDLPRTRLWVMGGAAGGH